ncbi:hypothetical protein tb265_19540 [Gemmatimonadetes bacterium T265]|nr:hypothetical protein tb265_19540 [Gemmatimonadetes bacterium T265]
MTGPRAGPTADLVVVGAGVVGASVAYHAAARGAAVTLVDRAHPGAGATGESFAWIGDADGAPGPAAALRDAVTADYRRLEAELDGVRVAWSGSLSWWGEDEPPRAAGTDGADGAAFGVALGPGQVVLDASAVAALEPNLREPPPWAVYAPGDGAVDPIAVTAALVRGAQDRGATIRLATTVHALHVARGRVVGVETSAGVLPGPSCSRPASTSRGCAPRSRRSASRCRSPHRPPSWSAAPPRPACWSPWCAPS